MRPKEGGVVVVGKRGASEVHITAPDALLPELIARLRRPGLVASVLGLFNALCGWYGVLMIRRATSLACRSASSGVYLSGGLSMFFLPHLGSGGNPETPAVSSAILDGANRTKERIEGGYRLS